MTTNNKVTKAHNNLFLKVFSEAKQAADFFSHYLPKEVVSKLDLSQLQQVPTSFVDEGLKDRHADLLFEAPLQTDPGRKTFLYLLLEHQSSFDPLMAYRLLAYMVRIWDWWLKEKKQGQKLPPILPAVLYHGQEHWRGGLEFVDLLDLDRNQDAALSVYMPNFRYSLTNLNELGDEEIAGEVISRLTLLLFKHGKDPDLPSWIQECLSIFRDLLVQEDGWRFFEVVVTYVCSANEHLDPETAKEAFSKVDEKAGELAVTVLEQLEERGRAKGVVEGKSIGVIEGKVSALLRLIQRRFGKPSPETIQCINEATEEQLDNWMDQILFAESIEQLLSD